MIFPEVAVVSRDGGNALYRLLFSARRGFLMAIRSFLSEPSAGLVAGVTVGEKGGIDKQTEEMFRRVGLIHIVVLSGYNITVVSDMVMRILSFLPRVLMLTFGGVAILFFVVATGASATAVRAGGMAVLALCARYVGARYDIVRALFFVAGGMLLYNPYTLYDPSFQLSFLATLGLITYSPILERKLFWVPKILSLRETLSTTLATQLFVLPLIVYLSGQVSLVSVFANIIVLPVVPMLMFFGSVLGIVAGIFSHAGFVLSFPAMAVSEYVLNVSEMFSRIPYSSVQVPYFSEAIVWCSYAVLVIILIRSRVRTSHVSSPN
jgi:competence protein ComEC